MKRKEVIFWIITVSAVAVSGVLSLGSMKLVELYVMAQPNGVNPRVESIGMCLWFIAAVLIATKSFAYYDKEIYHAER